MLALAAAPLGLRCHVYSPEKDSCALDVVHADTIAAYEDEAALARFAEAVDVVTYEFENVPAKTAAFLSSARPVLPDPKVLETTQDRLVEKNFITRLKIADRAFRAGAFARRSSPSGLAKVGVPAVLKTRTLGYDGKGQDKIAAAADAAAAWRRLKHVPCILEGFVDFQREVSVIAARSADGHVECFEVTENEHRDHILHISRVPAKVTPALEAEARRVATRIVNAFDYVGVMGVEMFVVNERAEQHVLVNEVAPRVHNSGHWTIDGATVSQFEQHIRAVAGWPLGKAEAARRQGRDAQPDRRRDLTSDAIGSREPNTAVHIYGKGKPSPRRKMGHVTRVWPSK